MARYRFAIVDVFTTRQFGGNPLAVLPDATGLDGDAMQRIAREFNFSETTFVTAPPPGSEATRRVRIFTPTREAPFAGHPNIGTAAVLAASGELGDIGRGVDVVFDERAGAVPVRIESRPDGTWCELRAPEPLTRGAEWPAARLEQILGLAAGDVATAAHPPVEASVGLPFLVVELVGADALARARINAAALDAAVADGMCADIHCYVRIDDTSLDTRMFAPHDGVPEDPATGSANCALAALLTALDGRASGRFAWRITQGVAMGRPSVLDARTEKRDGEIAGVWIGGYSAGFAEGTLQV